LAASDRQEYFQWSRIADGGSRFRIDEGREIIADAAKVQRTPLVASALKKFLELRAQDGGAAASFFKSGSSTHALILTEHNCYLWQRN